MRHYHLPASVSGICVLTRAGRAVYIGRSLNVYARLGSHAHLKRGGFDELIVFDVEDHLIDTTEKNLIAMFRPALNEVHYAAVSAPPCAAMAIRTLLQSEYGVQPEPELPGPVSLLEIREAKKREMEKRLARLARKRCK
jgi:hypothetical protein